MEENFVTKEELHTIFRVKLTQITGIHARESTITFVIMSASELRHYSRKVISSNRYFDFINYSTQHFLRRKTTKDTHLDILSWLQSMKSQSTKRPKQSFCALNKIIKDSFFRSSQICLLGTIFPPTENSSSFTFLTDINPLLSK